MAGVTLNQIATEISNETGDKAGQTAFISQCEKWLKDAMIEIDSEANQKAFSKPFQFSTQTGVNFFILPEDFRTFKYIRIINNDSPIDYINPKTLAQYGVDFEQQGDPRHFWIDDPLIHTDNTFRQKATFWPVPNTILELDSRYYFDVINVGSGDFLPLIPQAILCLKSRLRMQIAKNDKEWTLYNSERSQYAKDLAGLKRQEENKPARNLTPRPTDLPLRSRRPARLRYPFE